MEALLKLFGVRRRNQELLTFLLLLVLFVLVFGLLRSCIGGTQQRTGLVVQEPVIPNGAVVGQEIPFRGTFESFETVELYLNGEQVGTTRARRDGRWNFATEMTQPGKYLFQAVGTDSGRTVESDRYAFQVYTARTIDEFGAVNNLHNIIGLDDDAGDVARFGSGVPQIDPRLNGITVEPGRFFVTGSGTPGSRVLVTNNGAALGTTTVSETGRWRTNVNLLNEGNNHFEATNADVVGLSKSAANVRVAIPVPPPTIGIVRDGDIDTVNLRGRGEPGTTLLIHHNDDEAGTVIVSEFGTWSLTDVLLDKDDTSNTFTASAIDEAGGILATSAPVMLNVRRLVGGAADDGETVEAIAPPTLQAAISGDNIADLNGTGEPDTTLRITRNGEAIGTADVDADGNWSLDGVELVLGENAFIAEADGGVSSVDTLFRAMAAPTLQATANDDSTLGDLNGTGEPDTTLRIMRNGEELGMVDVDADGNWSLGGVELVAGENTFIAEGEPDGDAIAISDPATLEGASAVVAVVAPTLAAVADGNIANLNGTGEPNTTLTITRNGEAIGTADVDADGNWSLEGVELVAGDNTFVAQTDPDGDAVASSDPVTLEGEAAVVIIATPTLDAAADGDVASLSGTGEPNTTLTILRNGEEIGTVDADADGNWSFGGIELLTGDNTFIAQAESGEGGVLVSNPATLTVEVAEETDSETATIATPTLQGTASDNVADLSGTGEPNTTLTILRNGEAIGTADVDADGNWSLDGVELLVGDNTFVAQAESDSTIASVPTTLEGVAAAGEITINTPEYDLAAVTTDAEGVPVGTVNLSGTAAPAGATVTIMYDGEAVGEAIVGDDGTWTFSADLPLTPGDHTVYAIVEGEDGNPVESERMTLAGVAQTAALSVVFAEAAATDDGEGNTATSAADLPTVELILDASWSMTFPLDSDEEAARLTADNPNSRFGTARNVLIDIVNDSLVVGQPIGLRAFGNLRGNLACQSDLMVPVSPLDKTLMGNMLRNMAPQFNANTAIAASLAGAAQDLADVDGEITVVLLTDGQETCEGDPAAEIEALRDAGIDVKIDVVGFAILDDALREEFESWAELGGGTYYDARDADALAAALTSTLQQAPYRVLDADGEVVATGSVGGAAIELPLGEYTIEVGEAVYEVAIGEDGAEVPVE